MRTEVAAPAFLATVYHDEEDNAATDSRSEWHYSLEAAARWARLRMTEPYWNAYPSTVHAGFVVTEQGIPPRWEDDEDAPPWLIYADSMERDG